MNHVDEVGISYDKIKFLVQQNRLFSLEKECRRWGLQQDGSRWCAQSGEFVFCLIIHMLKSWKVHDTDNGWAEFALAYAQTIRPATRSELFYDVRLLHVKPRPGSIPRFTFYRSHCHDWAVCRLELRLTRDLFINSLSGLAAQQPIFSSSDVVPFRFTPSLQTFLGPIVTEGVFAPSLMAIGRSLTETEVNKIDTSLWKTLLTNATVCIGHSSSSFRSRRDMCLAYTT